MNLQDMIDQYATEVQTSDSQIDGFSVIDLSIEAYDGIYVSLEKSLDLLAALDHATNKFDASDRSQQSFEQYCSSMESIFIAAGIKAPLAIVVPSFEDKSETASKKAGIVTRVIAWVKDLMKRIATSIKKAFGLIKIENAKCEEKLSDIKVQLDKIVAHEEPNEIELRHVRSEFIKGGSFHIKEIATDVEKEMKVILDQIGKSIDVYLSTKHESFPTKLQDIESKFYSNIDGLKFAVGKIVANSAGLYVSMDHHKSEYKGKPCPLEIMRAAISVLESNLTYSEKIVDDLIKKLAAMNKKVEESTKIYEEADKAWDDMNSSGNYKNFYDVADKQNAAAPLREAAKVHNAFSKGVASILTSNMRYVEECSQFIAVNVSAYKVHVKK